MRKDIDKRQFSKDKLTESRQHELTQYAKEISKNLPGEHNISIEEFNGPTANAAKVKSHSAPAEKGNYVERALQHLQTSKEGLGMAPSQAAEYAVNPMVQSTSSDAQIVHAQQLYKGIPIFEAAQTVTFKPDGSIDEAVGNTITIFKDLDTSPKISTEEAVIKAAEYISEPELDTVDTEDKFSHPSSNEKLNLSNFEPKVITTMMENGSMTTILKGPPFIDTIKASIIWFPLTENNIRLSYEIIFTLPRYIGQYIVVVDAENGEILFNQQLINYLHAKGKVYGKNGNTESQFLEFPRKTFDDNGFQYLETLYKLEGLSKNSTFQDTFPKDWVTREFTIGNNAEVHFATELANGEDEIGPPVTGIQQNNSIVFDSPQPNDIVVNLFYHLGLLHDLFYLLGFQEKDGNFEAASVGSDPVDARVFHTVVQGIGSMLTSTDGRKPIMRMGIWPDTGRHTALDEDVIAHEFMHGVTNRLVGGKHNARALLSPQSRGMGEGWGDYVACCINDKNIVADWLTGNNQTGLRGLAYDENFPDNFGNLGKGRYAIRPNGSVPVHSIGEIWCATLLQMSRNIQKQLGRNRIGAILGLQLVTDALKLSQVQPSFLNMRDSILKALDYKLDVGQITDAEHKDIKRCILEAFAHFGMGPQAKSNGAQLTGIVSDFNLPS